MDKKEVEEGEVQIGGKTTPAETISSSNDAFQTGNGESSEVEVSPEVSPDADFASISGDFFDPPSAMSVTSISSADVEDNFGLDSSLKPSTARSQFFDAPEDQFEVSSENGTQTSLNGVEADVLLEEIERRKQAEETLDIMQKQWQKLSQRLSLEGLTLPAVSVVATDGEKGRLDAAGELCEQISLARAVSTSVGRESAKAEAEMELNSKIESKDFEIARLKKRLSYYEVVNHEISSRNVEAVEMTRSPRQRKRRQRWMWSSIGVSLMLGSAVLAWSFLTAGTGRGSTPSETSVTLHGDVTAKDFQTDTVE